MIQEQKIIDRENLSIIIFEVGWEQFAIDLLDAKEIVQEGYVRRLPRSLDFIEGIYNYRGDIIHIINLQKKLNLNNYRIYKAKEENIIAGKGDSKKKCIVIANINGINVGFMVDRIVNIAHVASKEVVGLSQIFQTSIGIEYIRGIVKFQDRPRILINLNKVLSDSEQSTIQKDSISLV